MLRFNSKETSMIRVIVGSVLSAVVLMAWGFGFWGFLPYGKEIVQKFPDEDRVLKALKEIDLPSGIYVIPYREPGSMAGETNKEILEQVQKRQKEGPLVQIVYNKEGADVMGWEMYAIGGAQALLASFFAAILLALAAPGLAGFPMRWIFVVLLGIFAAVAVQLGNVWFHHPWKPMLLMAGYDAAGWVLAAFVLALVITPSRGGTE
jgi:hypothetical protein